MVKSLKEKMDEFAQKGEFYHLDIAFSTNLLGAAPAYQENGKIANVERLNNKEYLEKFECKWEIIKEDGEDVIDIYEYGKHEFSTNDFKEAKEYLLEYAENKQYSYAEDQPDFGYWKVCANDLNDFIKQIEWLIMHHLSNFVGYDPKLAPTLSKFMDEWPESYSKDGSSELNKEEEPKAFEDWLEYTNVWHSTIKNFQEKLSPKKAAKLNHLAEELENVIHAYNPLLDQELNTSIKHKSKSPKLGK